MPDYNELFKLDSANKQIEMTLDGRVVINNSNIHGESFELSEVLCADNVIHFGQCNASMLKFTTSNLDTILKNKELVVKVSINNSDPYQIGKYRVVSDTPTADRHYREIVAYDALYDILNANVSEWYADLYDLYTEPTMKQMRDSFFTHFGIEQETATLPQDSIVVEETIGGDDISGKLIITSICELNGCFGHIGRDGKFQYIFLNEIGKGLFPSLTLYPSDTLYPTPIQNTTVINSAYYYDANYAEYVSKRITKLQIRQNEDDIGVIYGSGSNCYIVENNPLVYGKSTAQLELIAQAMYEQINIVEYRPATVTAKGNLTIPVGAAISISTTYKQIYSYVLERTAKGVQGLLDEYVAEGTEYRSENVNSVQRSIFQLKGKTNELERTIEETRSTITNVEAGLEAEIRQTADTINASVTQQINETKTYADNSATTKAAQAVTTADQHTDTKLTGYSTTAQMNAAIGVSATAIELGVSQTYATITSVQTAVDNLQAQIDDSIETFTGSDVPTLNNYPAVNWTTTAMKDSHIGDLYIVNSQGGAYANFYYRFEKVNGNYQWSIIQDTEIAKALADAAAALALAEDLEDDIELNYYTKTQTESKITESANSITSTVSANYETKIDASNKLSTAETYADTKAGTAESNAKSYTDNKLTLYTNTVDMQSEISQTSGHIQAWVRSNYETIASAQQRYYSLSSRITQTADSITAEVSRAETAEEELQAAIQINADSIVTKVSKGEVSSQISQEAGQISISANRLAINSTYFTLSADGKIKATDGEFSGKITASSGSIGGFTLDVDRLYTTGNDYGIIIKSPSTGGDNVLYIGNGAFKVTASGDTRINWLTVSSIKFGANFLQRYTLYGNIFSNTPTVSSGYVFSSSPTFNYNASVGGYVLSNYPSTKLLYGFSNSPSLSSVNKTFITT